MFEAITNRRKIRTLCKLSLSRVAEYAPNTWRIARQGFRSHVFTNRIIKSGGQIGASFKALRSRRQFINATILYKVFGTIVDRLLTQTLKVKNAVRYMDDTVIFSNDSDYLKDIQKEFKALIKHITRLEFSRWSIQNINRGVNFLGYRIWTTHKLIRKNSVKSAKRKILKLKGEKLDRFIAAWKGHIQHANTNNLQQSLGVI